MAENVHVRVRKVVDNMVICQVRSLALPMGEDGDFMCNRFTGLSLIEDIWRFIRSNNIWTMDSESGNLCAFESVEELSALLSPECPLASDFDSPVNSLSTRNLAEQYVERVEVTDVRHVYPEPIHPDGFLPECSFTIYVSDRRLLDHVRSGMQFNTVFYER